MNLCIIIPAYNEEKRIGQTLLEYSAFFEEKRKKIKGFGYEILVVINNTKDRTKEVVIQNKKNNNNIRYINLEKGGKGYAVTEGFRDAIKGKNDFIGFADADNATNAGSFWKLVDNIGINGCALASRYLKESAVNPKQSINRVIASRIYNMLIRAIFLFPYKDTQCGAKLFSHNALKEIIPSLTMSQWAFDLEILYLLRKKGFKIIEVPIEWSNKGDSKIDLARSGTFMVLGVIRLRLIHSPFRKITKIYDRFFGGLIKF